MSNQDEELKTKSPEEIQLIKVNEKLGKLIELNVELRGLNKEQGDNIVVLLGALCDSNDVIVTYKEEQKQGDITFRKSVKKQSKQSALLSVAGLSIACLALYVAIASLDGDLARSVVAWLDVKAG